MLKLMNLLALASIVSLVSVVVAEEQIPIGPNSAVVQVTPHRKSHPFEVQDISFSTPDSSEAPIRNTTSTHLKTSQHEDPDTSDSAQEISVGPSFPWLITSPYTTQEHLTNLSTLPLPSRLLTLALTHLAPTTTSYATTPYQDALNWPTIFTYLKSLSASHNHTWTTTTFYVVEFRSKLKSNIDRELLFSLDRESHREATASGGLLKYWFGKTSDDAEGRNLATCK